jgi:hypothetical protein
MKELLRALADSDREREAPPEVERRLKAAFRRKYKRRILPYFAAVAVAAGMAWFFVRVPKSQTHVQPQEIAVVTPPAPALSIVAKSPVVHRKPRTLQETVTEFYPLMEDPPPFERGELLRVSLPAAAMRSVGVPVSEDRLGETVQADVLVGQEGLARAIRFVNTSVNRP